VHSAGQQYQLDLEDQQEQVHNLSCDHSLVDVQRFLYQPQTIQDSAVEYHPCYPQQVLHQTSVDENQQVFLDLLD
jgi:hypothetical protein